MSTGRIDKARSGRIVPKKAAEAKGASSFYVVVTGQIEQAQVPGYDNVYADFCFTKGPDWVKIDGLDSGVTQISKKGVGGGSGGIVWNLPLDIIYKTTNVFGWPRLVITVASIDMFARDVLVGYGSLMVPTVPGTYVRTVRLFRPVSPTVLQQAFAWLTGNHPEFWDHKIVAQNRGREVTRVESTGSISIRINVTTRGMSACGFSNGAEVDSAPTDVAPSGAAAAQAVLPGSMAGTGAGATVVRSSSSSFVGPGVGGAESPLRRSGAFDDPSGAGGGSATPMGSRTPSGLMKLAGGRVGFAARTPTATQDGVAGLGSYRRSVRRIDAIQSPGARRSQSRSRSRERDRGRDSERERDAGKGGAGSRPGDDRESVGRSERDRRRGDLDKDRDRDVPAPRRADSPTYSERERVDSARGTDRDRDVRDSRDRPRIEAVEPVRASGGSGAAAALASAGGDARGGGDGASMASGGSRGGRGRREGKASRRRQRTGGLAGAMGGGQTGSGGSGGRLPPIDRP